VSGASDSIFISAVIVTKDEVHLLEDAVRSLDGLADEIIVCDMHSQDGTAGLAKRLGCLVLEVEPEPTQDPNARTAGIMAAAGTWVISLDPDMRVPSNTKQRLLQIARSDEADIVDFNLVNIYLGRRCFHGHGSGPLFRKMFRKDCFDPDSETASSRRKAAARLGNHWLNDHSFINDSTNGRVITLDKTYPLVHHSYQSVEQATEVLTRYARREASISLAHDDKGTLSRIVYRPLRSLVRSVVVKQGFRDGAPGIIIAFLVSYYIFLQEALIWDAGMIKKSSTKGLGRFE
jgi:glycosyltransferase involved in cell wall biosynthesis